MAGGGGKGGGGGGGGGLGVDVGSEAVQRSGGFFFVLNFFQISAFCVLLISSLFLALFSTSFYFPFYIGFNSCSFLLLFVFCIFSFYTVYFSL